MQIINITSQLPQNLLPLKRKIVKSKPKQSFEDILRERMISNG